MRKLMLAILTVAQLQAVAQTPAPVVSPDWAAKSAPRPDDMKKAIREGVRETLAEDDHTEVARRYQRDPRYGVRYGKFSAALEAAPGVPGCLGPNGLSRQNTYIFGGLLALPFLVVAAVTGKCN